MRAYRYPAFDGPYIEDEESYSLHSRNMTFCKRLPSGYCVVFEPSVGWRHHLYDISLVHFVRKTGKRGLYAILDAIIGRYWFGKRMDERQEQPPLSKFRPPVIHGGMTHGD